MPCQQEHKTNQQRALQLHGKHRSQNWACQPTMVHRFCETKLIKTTPEVLVTGQDGLSTPAQNCGFPIEGMGIRKGNLLQVPRGAAGSQRGAGRRSWRPGAASEACASPHVSMPACLRLRVRIPRRNPPCRRMKESRVSDSECLCPIRVRGGGGARLAAQ